MTDIPAGDAIIVDLRSQTLCLKDALATGDDRSILRAFEAVARARGLTELAADAGLDRVHLIEIVNESAIHHTSNLRAVVAGLIERWEAAVQNPSLGISEKDDLECGES